MCPFITPSDHMKNLKQQAQRIKVPFHAVVLGTDFLFNDGIFKKVNETIKDVSAKSGWRNQFDGPNTQSVPMYSSNIHPLLLTALTRLIYFT